MIQPGDVVIDVGAQVGLVTTQLAKIVGPAGHVHAIEPNPVARKTLQRALRINRLGNVTIHACAIGRESGQVEMEEGIGGLFQRPFGDTIKEAFLTFILAGPIRMIRVRSLDELIADSCLGPVALVKIDVDGPDFDVVVGAKMLLSQPSPPILIIEFSRFWRQFGYSLDTLVDFLNNQGYVLRYAPLHGKQLFPIDDARRIGTQASDVGKAINVYGFPPGQFGDRVACLRSASSATLAV